VFQNSFQIVQFFSDQPNTTNITQVLLSDGDRVVKS